MDRLSLLPSPSSETVAPVPLTGCRGSGGGNRTKVVDIEPLAMCWGFVYSGHMTQMMIRFQASDHLADRIAQAFGDSEPIVISVGEAVAVVVLNYIEEV